MIYSLNGSFVIDCIAHVLHTCLIAVVVYGLMLILACSLELFGCLAFDFRNPRTFAIPLGCSVAHLECEVLHLVFAESRVAESF